MGEGRGGEYVFSGECTLIGRDAGEKFGWCEEWSNTRGGVVDEIGLCANSGSNAHSEWFLIYTWADEG